MEKKDWRITGVPVTVIDRIKVGAKGNGLLIGEYLGLLVDDPAPLSSGVWTIKGVSGDTKRKLVNGARKHGIPLSKYLEYLAKEDEDKANAADDLRSITAVLKRYGKI